MPKKPGTEWPVCHFKMMTLHISDSDDSGRSDGYECDHCGHTIPLLEWLEKRDELIKIQGDSDEGI